MCAERLQRRPLVRQTRHRPSAWLRQHAQSALASLGRLVRAPWSTLMTIGVIGIALALPVGLHSLIHNVRQLTARWDGAASLTLFLHPRVEDRAAAALAERVRDWPEIAELRLITKAEALTEFRTHSGFAEALDALEDNPLPAALAVRPARHLAATDALESLRLSLQQLPEVEFAQLDLHWVQRLRAISDIATRLVSAVAGLLGLAVLLFVGNTIRLEIHNRRDEIAIMEVVGATPAFVRRPFLYAGVWYGLLGGLLAWLLVSLSLALLQGPALRLAALYQSGFSLAGLGPWSSLSLLGGSALLGLSGAWLSVRHHLARAAPA